MRVTTALASVLSSVFIAPAALAGPLDPPAGPVESTMKTLSDVEPRIAISVENTPGDEGAFYKITAPGSYYLTRNTRMLTLGGSRDGIEIAASDVTVDLNGYTIEGLAGMSNGIVVSEPDLSNIVVCNGTIRGFLGDGIDTQSRDVLHSEVRGVRVVGAGMHGIRLGDHAVVSDCEVSGSGFGGILSGSSSRVSDCTVLENGSIGGISIGGDSVVSGCIARRNLGSGVTVGDESLVVDCVADQNGSNGITAGNYSSVTDCVATGNEFQGIRGGISGVVRSCVASGNVSSGILVLADCVVVDNLCTENQRGLRATGPGTRIEGNHLANNDVGLLVEFTDNIVLRNTCRGNDINWSIVAGNHVAPIVQASGNGAQITGDTYAGSLGSTDPNANFTY